MLLSHVRFSEISHTVSRKVSGLVSDRKKTKKSIVVKGVKWLGKAKSGHEGVSFHPPREHPPSSKEHPPPPGSIPLHQGAS